MVFSSLTFLFAYLPLTLLVYFLAPLKWRNLVLLAVSLVFYGWGEPVYITIMVLSILIDYTHGLLVEKYRADDKKARRFVAQSVVFNLLLLGFFKYWDFLADNLFLLTGLNLPASLTLLGVTIHLRNIPLPIGISFFTFQTMSYTIDVYRRDAPVQRNIVNFGAFVTMFPQLIAGPIVKYKTVAEDLDHRANTAEDFALGACRFCVGLAKKVLLANSIGALWDAQLAAQRAGELTVAGGWMGLLAFGFQIYFDFSGYSDMAIGLGRIFGFHFNENFDYPYLSASVTEFWRRWHMSLTSWFREYLYIPLGGNRGGTAKTLRNILIVWFCTGFWHGASWNFILWGLYFAGWLILEKYVLKGALAKTPAWVKHLYTLIVVFVGWGIFAMEDLSVCGAYLTNCFGGAPLWSALDGYTLRSYAVTFLVLIVASTDLGKRCWQRLPQRVRQVLTPILMLLALIVSTAYLVDGSYNPFLYFRF
ncbi:MBOAT family O-acyltransferase [Dysosmobacter sp.]|uniref:MBOAT family O-acyltransferase n=1 Tax=Dysosmobacter sp. TaxID=2591382 RepID=UPI002A8ECC3B|nr:MBOAT family O-acyltransferase [Dysosmobacter sp.]MDY3984685.1 MBOAT family O-acyltransferase [Dysosmobacter sp.]